MVATQTSSITDFPAEMVAAVAFEADRQAEMVAQFLAALDPGAAPKNMMTPRFLLHLGAALRLLNWEAQGFYFHRAAGLPDADRAMRDATCSLKDSVTDPTELCVAALRLSIEKFAWNGPRELGIDVAVEEAQEDVLLEVLAHFLWNHRPR